MNYSVMIMSNNNHELLKECLRRIRKTSPSWEIIVVDDASEPAYTTEELGEVTLVRLPKRSNCCALRNVGMEMAKTDGVFWLDNDTLVEEGWWQPLVATFELDPSVGVVGQPKDSRLIRNPFLPLTQADCMIEYQFAYDYDHKTRECDFITSYCILVRKSAYRPTYCYNMPTPCLDPELGAVVKANGYKVVVCEKDLPVFHKGSSTPRPNGRNYLYYLSRNFTRWWNFWQPHASTVFELYKGKEVEFEHDRNEPNRINSKNIHDSFDQDFDKIPAEYEYHEN